MRIFRRESIGNFSKPEREFNVCDINHICRKKSGAEAKAPSEEELGVELDQGFAC
jgi:hypothetical protein